MKSVVTENTGVSQRTVLLAFVAGVAISTLLVLLVLLNAESFVLFNEAEYCSTHIEDVTQLQEKVKELSSEIAAMTGPSLFDRFYDYVTDLI